ncbi:MAG: nucleoside triphosphate pyrophosphohydrolase [Alphaproteobacteria bacterium]|nr:MAG: nucleoside triphosphate pyrophosphohydrolase [Alphaproteobacteria bacterium]
MDTNKDRYDINDLKLLVETLRDPNGGCPWDIEQTLDSITQDTIEEAYEITDAIERKDMNALKGEIGDMLFHTVFYSKMASEDGHFEFDDAVDGVVKKMIYRHPHVFGDAIAKTAEDVVSNVWEQAKNKENPTKAGGHYLDSVTTTLPALTLASKIQKKVQAVGFRFPDISDVFQKIDEETQELKEAIAANNQEHIEEEFGDLLFSVALLGRHCGSDNKPEGALRKANLKFIERFNAMEDHLKEANISLENASVDDMLSAWNLIKDQTKSSEKPSKTCGTPPRPS